MRDLDLNNSSTRADYIDQSTLLFASLLLVSRFPIGILHGTKADTRLPLKPLSDKTHVTF